jgi:hypothetical protein
MIRAVLVIVACTAFAALGVRDLVGGSVAVGLASLMLATANAILLTR